MTSVNRNANDVIGQIEPFNEGGEENEGSESDGSCPEGNCEIDINSISQGLKGGEAVLTYFDYKVDKFAKTFNEIPIEVRNLQKAIKFAGVFASLISVVPSGYNYYKGHISGGRLSYHITGSGISLMTMVFYGTGYGLVVGGAFYAGEAYYDAVVSDRAYNREAESSNVTTNQHGNTKKNRPNLSFESIDYYIGGDN